MTVQAFCEHAALSRATLYRLKVQGLLVKRGRRTLVDMAIAQAYLAALPRKGGGHG
jgi:hypothetical protein